MLHNVAENLKKEINTRWNLQSPGGKRLHKILRLDRDKRDQEIAYWFVYILDDINYVPRPPANAAYIQYKNSSSDQRKYSRFDYSLKEYLDKLGKTDAENNSNLYWLQWSKEKLPVKDTVNKELLEEKMVLIKQQMDNDRYKSD